MFELRFHPAVRKDLKKIKKSVVKEMINDKLMLIDVRDMSDRKESEKCDFYRRSS